MNIKLLLLSIIFIIVSPNAYTKSEIIPVKAIKSNNKHVSIIQIYDNKIHTFYGLSNSHIIETKNQLIVIDTQANSINASLLKKYVMSLNKPIKHIILSNLYLTHCSNYEIFKNSNIMTSKNILKDISNKKNKIKHLTLGKQNWDGLSVVIEQYSKYKKNDSIVIKIPEHGVLIAQNLLYNKTHLIANNKNKNWIKTLESFVKNESKNYHTILSGHGKSASSNIFRKNIKYLEQLQIVMSLGTKKKEVKDFLLKKFPNYKGKEFIDITIDNLF